MISQTAEYALRTVVFLGTAPETPQNRTQIAANTLIPADYLQKVLQAMDRAGLVRAQRGPGGGYRLTRSTTEITVYDVVTSVDQSLRIERCPLNLPDHRQLCPLHRKLDDAAALVEKAFRETFIADLMPTRPGAGSCRFPQPPPAD